MSNQRLRIGVTGATGYVGGWVCRVAAAAGHEVVRYSRAVRPGFRLIAPEGSVDVGGLDAVVNLAGEPILGRWTAAKKSRILRSRVEGTRNIVKSMAADTGGPRILINASAIGYYGDTREAVVDEMSPVGSGFLAETCRTWESAAGEALAYGIRVVCLRIGFVVGPGGAMRLVLPVFRCGLGGHLGNGRQWMSCIHVEDVAGMVIWALENESLIGPVNAVMPEPIRNSDFTRELAASLHRPAIIPAPALAMRVVLGELSHVMLDSARVVPGVAVRLGFRYRHSNLGSAFGALR